MIQEQIRLLQAVIIEKDRDIEVKINSGEKLQSKLESQEIVIRKLETDLKVSGDVNDQLRHQKAEQQEELENLRRTIAELEQMIHESMMRDEAQ